MSVEIGQSSFGRATGRPLTNTVAERSHKETEPKRRSLSGIARLLRLEGLSSLWNVHKKKNRSSDSYRLNNTSVDVGPSRELYDGQSSRRSSKEQLEPNEVYEDMYSPSFVNGRFSSRWNACSMLSKSDMILIQQNLASKRLAYDKTINDKLWDSEVRKKKFLGDKVYDQRGTFSSSLGGPTILLNPPISAKYGNSKSMRADKDITGIHNITYPPNGDDDLLVDPDYRHRAHKKSDIQLNVKNKENTVPLPILVLKPLKGYKQNGHGSSCYHSQDYVPDSAKMMGQPSIEKELSWRKTRSHYNAEFLTPEEARKLASKITRRLRDTCESDHPIYSRLRGYVIDESSFGAKESDMDSELEMLKGSSKSSILDDKKRSSHPSSRSLNEEAKKRLAERWKMTRRYQDLEIVAKGSRLGEMLSMPDGEKRSKQAAFERIDRSRTQVGCDNGNSMRHDLLGIISREGSNSKTERTSRSRSIPPIGGNIHRRGACHNMLSNEQHLLHSEPIRHGTGKLTKQYPSHKDTSQGSKFRGKKPLLCLPIHLEEIDSSSGARFEIEMEANVKALPYQKLMFQMAEEDGRSWSDAPEIVSVDAEHGITTMLSRTSLLDPDHSSIDNESSSSTAHDQKNFCHQELNQEVSEKVVPSSNNLGAEPISSESSKDVAYTFPVSDLGIRFAKDASSSSNPERVGAEVNDLRMQLQLLNMETGACDNPMQKDAERDEGWETSYILDVLILAGLQDYGFDLFRIVWHSPDCPLDFRLFDILEEKYRNQMSVSRHERMLLFDRINSALSEIFLNHVDMRPLEMPEATALMNATWQKERARNTIKNLIRREYACGMEVTERRLDREMRWLYPGEEIVLTGNEIEELLMEDMINEFLLDKCW